MDNVLFIESVTNLFMDRGFKTVTMDEIASEFGVSKRTLYEQYGSKVKLVELSIKNTIQRLNHLFTSISAENHDPVNELLILNERINSMIQVSIQPALIAQLQKYYSKVYYESMVKKDEMFTAFIHDNIIRGQKEGYYLNDITADLIAPLFYYIKEGLPKTKLGESEKWVDFQHSFFKIFLRGIVTEKGIQILNTYK